LNLATFSVQSVLFKARYLRLCERLAE